ncbi:MAG: hypothetical protein GXY32_00420 [Ruminococcaceae bacterium]|nr:hypothetical protein [Oscillospiraceae bacterium]
MRAAFKKWVSFVLAAVVLVTGLLATPVLAAGPDSSISGSTAISSGALEEASAGGSQAGEEAGPDSTSQPASQPDSFAPPEDSGQGSSADSSRSDDQSALPEPDESASASDTSLPDSSVAPDGSADGSDSMPDASDASLAPEETAEPGDADDASDEEEPQAATQGVDTVTLGAAGAPGASHANTLEDALDKVNDGGTIEVLPGSNISFSGVMITKNVTLKSQSGTQTLRQSAGEDAYTLAVSGCTVTLDNIILDADGNEHGSIVWVEADGTLVMRNAATLRNKDLKYYSGVTGGAGIYNLGTVTMYSGSRIENCKINSGSFSGSGGGAYNKGTMLIDESSIINCGAISTGGGIYNLGDLTINNGEIRNCTLTGDGSFILGAGIYLTTYDRDTGEHTGKPRLTMNGGTIAGCTGGVGTGIYVYSTAVVLLQGNVIIGETPGDNILYTRSTVPIQLIGPLAASARINCESSISFTDEVIVQPDPDKYPTMTSQDYDAFYFTEANELYYEFADNVVKSVSVTLSIGLARKVLSPGTSHQFKASFSNTAFSHHPLEWTSSDPGTIAVDQNGVATAVASSGTATITAKDTLGRAKASCRVTIGQPVEGVQLSQSHCLMRVGDTLTITVSVLPANALVKLWNTRSSNPSIVNIDYGSGYSTIQFTARALGVAEIIVVAEDGSLTAVCTITVTEDPIPVTGISLSKSTLKLGTAEKGELYAKVYPSNATNKNVRWYCSNFKVVDGYYHTDDPLKTTAVALKKGTAVLRVVTEDGEFEASCTVTVKARTHSISFIQGALSLVKGDTATVPARAYTYYGDKLKVKYQTSNKNVATVSSKGKITTYKTGNVTIKATASDGETATLSVKVVDTAIPLQTLELTQGPIKKGAGKYTYVQGWYGPADATGLVFTWKSSNEKVATVNEFGAVWPIKEGSTVITVSAGGLSASTTVNVVSPVKKIAFANNAQTLKKGKKLTLRPQFTYKSGYYPAGKPKLAWSSSKKSVATVSSKGVVTARKKGTATITVKTANGKKASVKIEVA